jgi:hypothetical protein
MKKPHREFVIRYLSRGAIGVSVGLATVAASSASAHQPTNREEPELARSFSDRLSTVWSAISDQATEPLSLAQIVPRPPPVPPFRNVPHGKIFTNQFNKVSPAPPPHGKIFTNQFNKLPKRT